MRDEIKAAIIDVMDENPNEMADKINDIIAAKVSDSLMTKKMEISNRWLNDIESPSEEDDGEE